MKLINVGIANLCVSDKLKLSYFNNDYINESKKTANEFLETVKNSPILTLEFKVFNNIENKEINGDLAATRYIDNNIKLFETFTADEIISEHSKLLKFFNNEVILDENKVKLYNSLSDLILESVSEYEDIDVDQIHESFTFVLNHIKKDKSIKNINESIISNEINEDVIEIAIDNFNQKYQELNEDDKTLIKKLISFNYNEKKTLFEDYKVKTISCFNKLNEEKYKDKIELAVNRINEMVLDEKDIDDNIIKLHELKKGLI